MANIIDIKNSMYSLVKVGADIEDVLQLLYVNNEFIAKETDLWDYKEEFENDKISLAKLVKRISAFHNSYGGYIIFGVQEVEKDKIFRPVEFDIDAINISQIRSSINNYLDGSIDVSYSSHFIVFNSKKYPIVALHVPKRKDTSNQVVKFIKNSPPKNEEKTKFVFKVNDVFYRCLDECKKVEDDPKQWQFLLSRRNEYENVKETRTVEYNLPDKQLICKNFIGRKTILSKLWGWVSDPIEYTKILAGDGGKGKTSIAYEFCLQIEDINSTAFERIIWMTAKKKQFMPLDDRYSIERDVDFSSFHDFLVYLCNEWGLVEEEFEGHSISSMKKVLKKSLPLFPSLIIVDDIDSLEPDEQAQLIESCLTLGSESVKFLITTRSRLGSSEDLCIQIKGLDHHDYILLINDYCKKYNLDNIADKNIEQLFEATDGSPLLTQSIIRLIKMGEPFNTALKEWKGQSGTDARNAVLKREIKTLSAEAQRILVCITFLDSCSVSELLTVSSLGKSKVIDALSELKALFLVDHPKLIEEVSRYSVSTTVKLLVNDIKNELVKDPEAIKSQIKVLREGVKIKRSGNAQTIGLAISQALALLKMNDEVKALETIKTELNRQPNHPDLLLAYGRILCTKDLPDYFGAIAKFKEAYQYKQNKRLLFEYWYICEDKLNSIVGRIEVCRFALKINEENNNYIWNYRMFSSLAEFSASQNNALKINTLVESSFYLSNAIRFSNTKDKHIEESSKLHQVIINILNNDDSISWLDSCLCIFKLIQHGNKSYSLFRYAKRLIRKAEHEYNNKKHQDKKTYKGIILAKETFYKLQKDSNHNISLD